MTTAPMLCPKCGAPMNRHAEKPTEPRTRAEAESVAQGSGIVIETIHQCPRCGWIEDRRGIASGFGHS